MPTTTARKLKIKEGDTLLTLHAPESFTDALDSLPYGVKISAKTKSYRQIHWFVRDKAQLDEEIPFVVGLLKEGILCWIYFPKGSSKIQTDLNRDKGWESLAKYKNLQRVTLISFNETWSAFCVRLQTAGDAKKAAATKERPVAQYIDTANRKVYLPDDFVMAFENAGKEKAFFESLSYSNQKEYVEWIVSAKREETRKTRLNEAIERLAKGWKNPANR